MSIKIITCWDDNYGIGYQNKLPWCLPEDLKWFQQQTLNSVVVMGRKTWESLSHKPLPNRENIVLTSKSYVGDNVWHCKNWSQVLSLTLLKWPTKDIYIIGGETIYRYALEHELIDEVLATHIYGVYEVDVFFPYYFLHSCDKELLIKKEKFERWQYIFKEI